MTINSILRLLTARWRHLVEEYGIELARTLWRAQYGTPPPERLTRPDPKEKEKA